MIGPFAHRLGYTELFVTNEARQREFCGDLGWVGQVARREVGQESPVSAGVLADEHRCGHLVRRGVLALGGPPDGDTQLDLRTADGWPEPQGAASGLERQCLGRCDVDVKRHRRQPFIPVEANRKLCTRVLVGTDLGGVSAARGTRDFDQTIVAATAFAMRLACLRMCSVG